MSKAKNVLVAQSGRSRRRISSASSRCSRPTTSAIFFYNGGNDSMDTAHKVAELAAERGLDLASVGVPKTIDNDVGDSGFKLIDHTPGYGSVARYWALTVQNADQENAGSCPADPVLVMQAMGRQRFARLQPLFAEKKLPVYAPQAAR